MTTDASTLAAEHRARAERVLEQIRTLVVTDAAQIELAIDIARDVKARWATVDGLRRTITEPLTEALGNVNGLFRPALEALKEAEEVLKGKVATAKKALEVANRQAMQETQRELQSGNVRGAALASMRVEDTAAPAGTSFRERWRFEIEREVEVPREFCSPDPKKIRAFVSVYGDTKPIAGVRVFKDIDVAIRKGRP